jgi:hypothetical protein
LDDRFDDPLIDDVARAMTSASSDGRLAERVALALSERSESKGRGWMSIPIAAGVAIALIAVLVVREDRVDQKKTQGADISIAPTPAETVTRIIRTPPPAIDPIELEPIAIQPLVETNAIQISPIAIDRIEISLMP